MVDSPGGPIYRQARVGKGGRVFICWKFRSMRRGADAELARLMTRNEADGLIFKMADDPRRTRVGKFLRRTSLDELPQLWNVLRGDMCLVGPRPPTVPEVLRYDQRHLQRLAARPGMTGLWQVTLRNVRHDFGDMVELDSRYARELSLKLDLEILLRTIPTVLSGKGSY
jgi:lipopolysaccharide/colanic/teichoic acid biosynthesis glycosyltransferase